MKFYVFIIIVYLFVIFQGDYIFCELYTFEPPNLKTVLFKEAHLEARCWSIHEVNLLMNRRLMQDLIPRKIPRDLPLLLKYLKSIEDIVAKIPPGINQTLLMAATGDVLGAYLQAIVIPIANEAYYAGNVDYTTVAELHNMLDKWKWYLNTDGSTWSKECDMSKIPTKVATLEVSLHDPDAACQELYVFYPASNRTEYLGPQTIIAESSRIAIPYLDNNLVPNAIALPLKQRNLYSLMDPKAAYILVKYYTLSMRCLSGNVNDVLAFNNFFHLWIASKVVPHLHDHNRWYPAFGAVMRVVETIKKKSLASTNSVFVQPMSEERQDAGINTNLDVDSGSSLKYTENLVNYFHILNNPYAILVVFVILIAILIFMCCLCMCCYFACCTRKKIKKTVLFSEESEEQFLKNVVISLFCGLKNSLTGNWTKLGSAESLGESGQDINQQQTARNIEQPTLDSYPHNTPYSISEGEYSTTSEDD